MTDLSPVEGGVAAVLMAAAWTKWSDERPTDGAALYRWRIPARMVRGMLLAPEWTEKMSFVGMGHDDPEWWPGCSSWNGYVRRAPEGLEWRLAAADETAPVWGGLDLLPCPWTGKPPRVEVKTRWCAAPIFEVEQFILRSRFGTTYWSDANDMVAAWNTRPPAAQASATSPSGGV